LGEGLRNLTPLSIPVPPPGSFQHLLASMTSSAAKARAAGDSPFHSDHPSSIPSPSPSSGGAHSVSSSSASSTSPQSSTLSSPTNATPTPSSPPAPDRRSSSIAALRLKAREHEMRLGVRSGSGVVF
jgi:hypothetical protein